jgi:hypothetical protein
MANLPCGPTQMWSLRRHLTEPVEPLEIEAYLSVALGQPAAKP